MLGLCLRSRSLYFVRFLLNNYPLERRAISLTRPCFRANTRSCYTHRKLLSVPSFERSKRAFGNSKLRIAGWWRMKVVCARDIYMMAVSVYGAGRQKNIESNSPHQKYGQKLQRGEEELNEKLNHPLIFISPWCFLWIFWEQTQHIFARNSRRWRSSTELLNRGTQMPAMELRLGNEQPIMLEWSEFYGDVLSALGPWGDGPSTTTPLFIIRQLKRSWCLHPWIRDSRQFTTMFGTHEQKSLFRITAKCWWQSQDNFSFLQDISALVVIEMAEC